MKLLKKIVALLPDRWQTELKRLYFGYQIKSDKFITKEPEYEILHTLINPGEWVIDVGANVGHYTMRFSELVGPLGRVVAFEPVPTTFSLLSANALLFKNKNVTLINSAVSEKLDVCSMSMPIFSTGLTNFYEAHLTPFKENNLSVLTISLDAISIDRRISLVKIDAEGHEAFVFKGMKKLIELSRPLLIVETSSEKVIDSIVSLNYIAERLEGSPNVLFRPKK